MDQVKVQLIFREDVKVNGQTIPFQDALYFTPEQWVEANQGSIDALKQERISNWKNLMENPPKEVEPTKEQVQEQIKNLEDSLVQMQSQKEELQTKLTSISAQVEPLEG